MKKFLSLVLVLTLVLALAAPVFADMEGDLTGGSITINDAVPGQVYSIYQILYLESYDATTNAYSYKANSAWEAWLRTQTDYVAFDDQGYVTWVDGANAAAFAKLAQVHAQTLELPDNYATAPAAAEGEKYSTVKFENLNLGYYLVDSDLGTLCSLDTTNPNVTMEEKNDVPTNVKEVKEDSNDTWGTTNDADIGQTVEFRSTITAQAGAENYTFHDTMSAGLTYTGVTSITLNDATVADTNYTLTTTCEDGCTFEVAFTQAFCDTLKANDKIVISYTATVNENAKVGLTEGNPNKSNLEYGDKSSTKVTPDSTTVTYTWDVNVFKYTLDGETEKPLSGAVFTLSKNADGTNPIALVDQGNNVYRVAKEGETGTVTEITTPEDGSFFIEGLDADTYYLTETEAPTGYNKLAGPITVVIDNEGNTKVEDTVVETVKVVNKTGTELPSTGGIGTTIFYIVGAVLMAGAAILLITKKRMSAE